MKLESDHEQDNALLAYLPVEMTQFPNFVFDVLLRVATFGSNQCNQTPGGETDRSDTAMAPRPDAMYPDVGEGWGVD